MTADNEPTPAAPIASESAPRLHLVVQAGSRDEMRIGCRRVVTLIGSRSGCKVTLRHADVSAVHTAIVNDGTQILAVDLVTRHGTLLNGLKLEHERLSSGDVLAIPPWEFRVEIDEPAGGENADVRPFRLEPDSNAIVLEHQPSGRLLRPTRSVCVLGRRGGCDIVVADNRVSRVHALLLNQFGRPAVFDLLSRNGTFVNENRIGFHLLHEDDVITVGESAFSVRFEAAAAAGDEGDQADKTTETAAARGEVGDLIDIQETEASQTWRIAEHLKEVDKVARKA